MEHIELCKTYSNQNEIQFNYSLDNTNYLIIVDVEYWTIKQDSYGVCNSSWIEVDSDSFEFSYQVFDLESDDLTFNDAISADELKFIEQECINYLNDEYV